MTQTVYQPGVICEQMTTLLFVFYNQEQKNLQNIDDFTLYTAQNIY